MYQNVVEQYDLFDWQPQSWLEIVHNVSATVQLLITDSKIMVHKYIHSSPAKIDKKTFRPTYRGLLFLRHKTKTH